MKRQKLDLQKKLTWKQRKRLFRLALIAGLGFIILSLFVNLAIRLPLNSAKPVDGILVLGGSIRREIYGAKLAIQYPDLPILISQGSKEPCIRLIFERSYARLNQVWLEKCANSTFGNFFFSVPILRRWGVHKVKVVTSPTHMPRAQWLAQIHLGAQGIATEMDLARERGVPGNHESQLKTTLDVTRSIIWGFLGQIIYPPCWDVTELKDVDVQKWYDEGFTCEAQGKVLRR